MRLESSITRQYSRTPWNGALDTLVSNLSRHLIYLFLFVSTPSLKFSISSLDAGLASVTTFHAFCLESELVSLARTLAAFF